MPFQVESDQVTRHVSTSVQELLKLWGAAENNRPCAFAHLKDTVWRQKSSRWERGRTTGGTNKGSTSWIFLKFPAVKVRHCALGWESLGSSWGACSLCFWDGGKEKALSYRHMFFQGTDFIKKAASASDYPRLDLNLCFQNKSKLSDSKASLHIIVLPKTVLFCNNSNGFLPPEHLETHCNSQPHSPPKLLSEWLCSFGPLFINGTFGNKILRLSRVCTYWRSSQTPRW